MNNKENKTGCEALLGLLKHLCGGGNAPDGLYEQALEWHAYPLQHPGVKMRTALVIQGSQGTGKSLWAKAITKLYGDQGGIVGLADLQGKHNGWASGKRFLVVDEATSESLTYEIKCKLKQFLTGDYVRINPQNEATFNEKNQVNMCFLSNEPMPVLLERDDRRHIVLGINHPQTPEFYEKVQHEINNGGLNALRDYLLSISLGDFNEHTEPPKTEAEIEAEKAEIFTLIVGFANKTFNNMELDELVAVQHIIDVLHETKGKMSENSAAYLFGLAALLLKKSGLPIAKFKDNQGNRAYTLDQVAEMTGKTVDEIAREGAEYLVNANEINRIQ